MYGIQKLIINRLFTSYKTYFICLSFLILTVLSCSKKDDRAAIINLIRKGADLAEKHEIGDIMDLAKDDFVGMPGEFDERETKALLWRTFNYYKAFKILYPKPEIAIEENGQNASAKLPFLIVKEDHAFKKLKDLFEDPKQWVEEAGKSADIYRLELELVKSDEDWLVQRARVNRFI